MRDQVSTISAFYSEAASAVDDTLEPLAASLGIGETTAGPKIAYLVSEYPKVSHSFIRREIQALEKRGWRVTRLTIRKPSADLIDPADLQERSATICVLERGALPLVLAGLKVFMKSPFRLLSAFGQALGMAKGSDKPFVWHLIYLAEACWLSLELIKRGIRHLHAHFGTNPAEVAMLVGMLSEISYSFTVHGPEEFDRARHIHLKEKVARAKVVVAISSYSRSQLFRVIDHDDWNKVHIVHCGIDQAFSNIATVKPSLRRRLVCVGRLCEQKGQLLLVEAMARLARDDCAFDLVLVGDGQDRIVIEQKILEHGLSERVRITGWASAEKVKQEMLLARAVVMPSFAEGLPVVLMEAMALGRPVLSTYIAGIPELVVDKMSGWLFPAGSIEEMAAAIRACLSLGEDHLREMGCFARARSLERHDIDQEALKLERIFQSVVGG